MQDRSSAAMLQEEERAIEVQDASCSEGVDKTKQDEMRRDVDDEQVQVASGGLEDRELSSQMGLYLEIVM